MCGLNSSVKLTTKWQQFTLMCKCVNTVPNHVRASVCCTQVSYGGLQGVYREGTLSDFMDLHAYWQHPRFPGKPTQKVKTSRAADAIELNIGPQCRTLWYAVTP